MNVVLGISGGIAVYKICTLVRLLKKAGNNVNVIMTKNACKFVTELTFRTLSNNPVVTDMFEDSQEWEVEHISLAKKADIFVVAPATLNIIGKIAGGIADDMLTTTIMATKAPVLFVPAMNTDMYNNKIFQKNIADLKGFGYYFMEPDSGFLACKDEGAGRLPEPKEIFNKIVSLSDKKHDLEGVKILVTAGPTRENIDPVRYISNYSSGKMGYSIAKCAKERGAKVFLITGPCNTKIPSGIDVLNVQSAIEMHNECIKRYDEFDIIILVAAVADYSVINQSVHKIKKSDDELIIKLKKNPDIAKDIGINKKNKILVGFCAETENLFENAIGKMESKKFDIIVANDVTKEGAGFDSDTNIVTIFDKEGGTKNLPKLDKYEVADKIINYIKEYKAKFNKEG